MKKTKLFSTLLVAGAVLLTLGACDKKEIEGEIVDGEITETSTSLTDDEEVIEDNIDLKDDGYFKEIVYGDQNPKVKFEAEYKTDWKDDSWEDVDFEIDKVKVVEVDKFKDGEEEEYKGLLSMHFTLKNDGEREVSIHPSEATLVLEDGTEIKAEHFADYWEDIFEKDKQKDGYVHFKFDETDELDQIKEIHLTFKGHYTDSDDKEAVDHEYDVQLPLELQQ